MSRRRASELTRWRACAVCGVPGLQRVLSRLDGLGADVEQRRALESALEAQMTERRLLVFALAYEHPLGTAELAEAVRATRPSLRFLRLGRLRHRAAAFRLLYDLERCGLLERVGRGRDVRFRLPRHVHAAIGAAFASTGHRQPAAS